MRILTAKEVNFVSGGFDALTCPGLNSDGNDVQKSKEGADGENAGSSGGEREVTYEEAHNQMCEAINNTILIGSSVGTVCGIAAVTIPAAQAPGAACSAMGGVVALVGSVASKIGGC